MSKVINQEETVSAYDVDGQKSAPHSDNHKEVISQEEWKKKCSEERELVEKKRLEHYGDMRAKNEIPDLYKAKVSPDKKTVEFSIPDITKNSTIKDKNTLYYSTLCAACGTADEKVAFKLLMRTVGAQFCSIEEKESRTNEAIKTLVEMRPNDIIEAHLCSRLIILENQYTEYFRRAAVPEQYLKASDTYINLATKLMRAYNETNEQLTRYRRKGEQHVTVQHVNVNGGQTVVAGQFNGGGTPNES